MDQHVPTISSQGAASEESEEEAVVEVPVTEMEEEPMEMPPERLADEVVGENLGTQDWLGRPVGVEEQQPQQPPEPQAEDQSVPEAGGIFLKPEKSEESKEECPVAARIRMQVMEAQNRSLKLEERSRSPGRSAAEFPTQYIERMPRSCSQCRKPFSCSTSLRSHQGAHPAMPYQCEECGKVFAHLANLRVHERGHVGPKPSRCPTCKRRVMEECKPRSPPLEAGMEETGEASQDLQVQSEVVVPSSSTASQAAPTVVWQPWLTHKREDGRGEASLIGGMQLTENGEPHSTLGPQDEEISENLTMQDRRRRLGGSPIAERGGGAALSPALIAQQNPFKCSGCQETFYPKFNLLRHQRICTAETPFKCVLCEKGFKESSSFSCHLKTHTGERPFKCRKCGETFKLGSQLILHRRTHTAERLYECSECGWRFRSSHFLKAHQRSHTGE